MNNKKFVVFLFVLAFASMFSVGVLALIDSDLTISPGNVTYNNAVTVTCTSPDNNVKIYRNSTDVTSENNTAIVLNATTDFYQYNCTSTQSPIGVNKTLIVSKSPTSVTLSVDVANNSIVDRNWTINFTIITNATSPVPQPVDLWTNYSNGLNNWASGVTPFINLTNLSITGPWIWLANYTGNDNYSANINASSFNISVINIAPRYENIINPSGNYTTAPVWFNITWKDGAISEVRVNVTNSTHNFTQLNQIITTFDFIDNNTRKYYTSLSLPAGDFNINWYAADAYGLNNTTGNISFTINKVNALTDFYNPSSNTIDSSVTLNATCISSNTGQITATTANPNPPIGQFTLTKNNINVGSTLSSGAIMSYQSWSAGLHTFECKTPGNQNYSSQTLSHPVTVTQAGGGTPAPGPSPGPGGPNISQAEFKIQNLNDISVAAGGNGSTTFNVVTVNQARTIANIQITLEGVDASWFTAEPNGFSLDIDESKTVTLTFNIPADAEEKLYPVTVTANGAEVVTTTAKTASAGMVLTVGTGAAAGPTGAPFSLPTITLPANLTGILLIMGLIGGVVLYIFREQFYGKLREARRPSFRGYKPSPKPAAPQS